MTIRNLEKMFRPQSLALIGASNRERSVGQLLMKNVLASGFSGPIMPVNPKHASVGGILAYPSVEALPLTPDLAVICIAPEAVPQTIAALGARGTRAAVVISAGFGEIGTEAGKALERAMLDAARPHAFRIIGPNCLGIMAPGSRLNASFAHIPPAMGDLAFVSQSGAVCTAILDYVAGRGIGFSHFISLGNCADVDFGDMLDYLAADPDTKAILLYMESVTGVRKFMSAGRAAAHNKPVIVIKSGRNKEGARAAASHTGALIGSDAVYDVAFKRAGMLRVYDMEELFDAVETLARLSSAPWSQRLAGNGHEQRLAIISNGGGPAVLATDNLIAGGGTLAELAPETIEKLNAALPPTWSHGNPIDIIGDADGARYARALGVMAAATEADALFVMKCPTAVSDNLEAAQAVVDCVRDAAAKPVFTCWLGDATVRASRARFAEHHIPTYATPEKAIGAFLHMAQYRHNQAMLMEIPPAARNESARDKSGVLAIIAEARAEGRAELFENEAKDVLSAYGISTVRTLTARSAGEAAAAAQRIGFPVAIKILSPDISHKSDVGGVMLGLQTPQEVERAAAAMLKNVEQIRPQAKLEGFTVQQMAAKRDGYELIVGATTDRQFGPVIMFGEGGVAVEVLDDKALGLPPLNRLLAREMIRSTRVWRRLKGFRDRKPVRLEAVENVILQVSQLMSDIAAIGEIDINPLVADDKGVIALDARIKLAANSAGGCAHLAISAYPEELCETVRLKNGTDAILRPVRPEDAQALRAMILKLTPHDLYQRFRGEYPALSAGQIARITHIDYDRDMVFVATPADGGEIFASLVCTMHPGAPGAEFTVAVRPDMKNQGLGRALTEKIIHYIRTKPLIAELFGYVLPGNQPLLAMVREFGFHISDVPAENHQPAVLKVSKRLENIR